MHRIVQGAIAAAIPLTDDAFLHLYKTTQCQATHNDDHVMGSDTSVQETLIQFIANTSTSPKLPSTTEEACFII